MVTPGTPGTPQNKSTQVQKQVQNAAARPGDLAFRQGRFELLEPPGGARTRAPAPAGQTGARRRDRARGAGQACRGGHRGPILAGAPIVTATTVNVAERCGACGLELAVVSWRRDAYEGRPRA
jgi:hypothetical protein